MINITPATPVAIHQVALKMRESDFEEFRELLPVDQRPEMAMILVERYSAIGGIYQIGQTVQDAIIIGGGVMLRPNVHTMLMYATDEFPNIAFGFTRWLIREWFPLMTEYGIHRFEAVVSAKNTKTQKWLQTLDFHQEAFFPSFGKNRQDFLQFARIN